MRIKFKSLIIFLLCGVLLSPAFGRKEYLKKVVFKKSAVSVRNNLTASETIHFNKNSDISSENFFEVYKREQTISKQNTFIRSAEFRDELGYTHKKYKQYYKDIEINGAEFIIHEKNGRLRSANGRIIKNINLDINPTLNENNALQKALEHIAAKKYMWQSPKAESHLKEEQHDRNASYRPVGQLMLTCGAKAMTSENMRLTYRFDIYALEPLSRNYVFVDANSGEIIKVVSRIHSGDVQGTGNTLYNGVVNITVSDQDFPSIHTSRWHTAPVGESDSESAWWMGDESFGTQGGYDNTWYMVLDTDSFLVSGTAPLLSFRHRYGLETPGGEPEGFDGWDGINVRISTDNGATWQVLKDPVPAYDHQSLYSFGFEHGEGQNIPGWTGIRNTWHQVTIYLSDYVNQKIRLRFAFASGPGYSTKDDPKLFGWQIDEIEVKNSQDVLFYNGGTEERMSTSSVENTIDGKYRLRQKSRSGIYTFDSRNKKEYALAVDFVDADSNFTTARAAAGVNVYWAVENTYDYYKDVHGYDSYDNNSAPILAYVHYDSSYFNAFWDGQRIVFGDGYSNMIPLTSLDVSAHELTHGITEFSAGLEYQNEPGALNESFSDIFGAIIEFLYDPENSDWLIGEDFQTLRSMINPNDLLDPDTYKGLYWKNSVTIPSSGNDYGGVHSNSGVQNKWFYLLVEGGSGTDDNNKNYSVQSIGMADAAKIAFRNLTTYLTSTSNFSDARAGALFAATDLFGSDSDQLKATANAWDAVGVYYPLLAPTILVNKDTLLFLSEEETKSDSLNVEISNMGFSPLVINGITTQSENFKVVNLPPLPFTLSYNESITLQVEFSSERAGDFSDVLSIFSNDTSQTSSIGLKAKVFSITEAAEDNIYYISNKLFNIANGLIEELGNVHYSTLRGLDINPSSNFLYSLNPKTFNTDIVVLSSKAGENFVKTTINLGNLTNFAFISADSFYSIKSGKLYRINAENGNYYSPGSLPLLQIEAMAVYKGDIFVIDVNNDLFRINTDLSGVSKIGNTGIDNIKDLTFNSDGQLLAVADAVNGSDLVEINISTGFGKVINSTGQFGISGIAIRTNISPPDPIPEKFSLLQNYPNPFNEGTIIEYHLPQESKVELVIFDSIGRQVTTLVKEQQPAQTYKVPFNAHGLSSGIYYYMLKTNDTRRIKKMVLLQ